MVGEKILRLVLQPIYPMRCLKYEDVVLYNIYFLLCSNGDWMKLTLDTNLNSSMYINNPTHVAPVCMCHFIPITAAV